MKKSKTNISEPKLNLFQLVFLIEVFMGAFQGLLLCVSNKNTRYNDTLIVI